MSKRVILREDDEDLASLVTEILEDAGYSVIHAVAIPELLEVARRSAPCVALLDGSSPTGYDLWWLGPKLLELGVPPVAFTAHSAAVKEFERDNHGFVGVIGKPFDADEFVEVVNQICWDQHHAVAS